MTEWDIDMANKALFRAAYEDFEKKQLSNVMQLCKYNQSRAALVLGISRSTLRTRLRRHFGTIYFRDTEE